MIAAVAYDDDARRFVHAKVHPQTLRRFVPVLDVRRDVQDGASRSSRYPLVAVATLFLVFQLVLRPGIAFF
jgi:hypothetical protein